MRQLVKQLLFYFLSLIFLLPHTLSCYNYNKAPQVKLDVALYPNNSRKINLSHGYSIRSARQTSTYFILFRTPAEWFQVSFQNEKPAIILENYWLYEFPGFRKFIKTFPDYEEHIQKIHKKLLNRWRIVHYSGKIFVANSPSNAQKFIQQMADKLAQDKKKTNNNHKKNLQFPRRPHATHARVFVCESELYPKTTLQ